MKTIRHTSWRLAFLAGALAATFALPVNATAATAPAAVTAQTVPTRYIDAAGTRLAYRRFGKPGGVPLLFLQHFTGTLDNWDPQVVNALARGREVILFDNAGVAGSGGTVPTTIAGMATHGVNLLKALNVHRADLLGFSMGSLVAQQMALDQPDLVRRVILVGSGPRGGVGMATLTPEFQAMLAKPHADPADLLLDVFFTPSPASQAAGRAFLARLAERKTDRDTAIDDKVVPAQVAAFAEWGAAQSTAQSADYLKHIAQPVLVVSGSHDIVHYTINAYNLQQQLPNAQLVIYPDSSHGALYQYPDRFVHEAESFLK